MRAELAHHPADETFAAVEGLCVTAASVGLTDADAIQAAVSRALREFGLAADPREAALLSRYAAAAARDFAPVEPLATAAADVEGDEQASDDLLRRLYRAHAGAEAILAELQPGAAFSAALAARFDMALDDAEQVAAATIRRLLDEPIQPHKLLDAGSAFAISQEEFALRLQAAAAAERLRDDGLYPRAEPRPTRPPFWMTPEGKAADARGHVAYAEAKRAWEAGAPPEPPPPAVAAPITFKKPASPLDAVAKIDPFDLKHAPGLLGDMARFAGEFAFRPVAEFRLVSALATVAPLFGRRFCTPTGAGLNLYLTALMRTGGGKEAVLAAPQAALDAAGFGWLLGAGDFSSDAALEVALRHRPNQVLFLDEVGKLLQAVQGKNAASFQRLAAKALLELYTKSGPGGRWTGKQKAGDDRDKAAEAIYSPTLTLLGCSTLEGFYEGLTEQNLGDGFINRLTVVRGSAPGPRNASASRLTPPAELLQAIRRAYEASSAPGNLTAAAARSSEAKPALRSVPWGDGGEDAWTACVDAQDDMMEAGREGTAGRYAEQIVKYATLRALCAAPASPAVTAEDVAWARALVDSSLATIEEGAAANMAGSEFQALVKAIERAVLAAGPDGVKHSYLLRAKGVAKHDDRMVEGALKRLESMGVIFPPAISAGPGRPGRRIIAKVHHGAQDW